MTTDKNNVIPFVSRRPRIVIQFETAIRESVAKGFVIEVERFSATKDGVRMRISIHSKGPYPWFEYTRSLRDLKRYLKNLGVSCFAYVDVRKGEPRSIPPLRKRAARVQPVTRG